MGTDQKFRNVDWTEIIIFVLLIVLPLGLVGYKVIYGGYNLESLVPVQTYDVTVSMNYVGHGDTLQVRTFLPVADDRVTLESEAQHSDLPFYAEINDGGNRIGVWDGPDITGPGKATANFHVYSRAVSFNIDPAILVPGRGANGDNPYLQSTDVIQVEEPEIVQLSAELAPVGTPLVDGLMAIHRYCQDLEVVSFKGTTDAVTTLRLGEASCNGKSRLFVALARAGGIPARLVGGLILDQGTKKTSHQWVEVLVGPYWIPFCPTNDHAAAIPAHYLPLYRGDEVMFRHSRDINFDYRFRIRRQEGIRADLLKASLYDPLNLISVLDTLEAAGIGFGLLKVLLMIPLGTLVLTILRNVIGLQTFGTFLPILIAIASRQTGLFWGLAVFLLVIILISLIRLAISRLDLLHIPQMSILLSFAVIFVLALGAIGVRSGYMNLAHITMFPIAILAITTERFSLMMEEEGPLTTARITFMSGIAIAVCFLFMNAMAFQILFLTFPELILVVLFLNIWLGRWVGLRVIEYWRFRNLLKQEGAAS